MQRGYRPELGDFGSHSIEERTTEGGDEIAEEAHREQESEYPTGSSQGERHLQIHIAEKVEKLI
jgi:hypothetical protein